MMYPTEMMMRVYVIELLKELEAARGKASSKNAFDLGKRLALYESLDVLINRCTSFGIAPAYLGLDNVRPERFL